MTQMMLCLLCMVDGNYTAMMMIAAVLTSVQNAGLAMMKITSMNMDNIFRLTTARIAVLRWMVMQNENTTP